MPRSTSPRLWRPTALLARLPAVLMAVVVWTDSSHVASAVGESTQQGVWPLDPVPSVTHSFDPPSVPWGTGHRGVDLAAHPGQVVRSALAGRLSFVGVIAGVPIVTVHSGAVRTTYQPVMASLTLASEVQPGDILGTVATVGSHCLPQACLHWGLIRDVDQTYLDPLSLVQRRRVRLVPLWRDLPDGLAWMLGPHASGAGMGLLEGSSQAIGADVGVELRRGQ